MRALYVALFTALLVGCGQPTQPVIDGDAPKEKGLQEPPKEKVGERTEKALVALTPAAASKLKELIAELIRNGGAKALSLRVRVVEGEHKLDLEMNTDPAQDQFSESRGVPIVVDRTSAREMSAGTIIDYIDDEANGGFKVIPPSVDPGPPDEKITFAEARRGFKTALTRRNGLGEAPPEPPAGDFRLVKYDSPVGKLPAYLTPDPKDGKKHPAIIWLTGGFSNGIGATAWAALPEENDQSAAAYRKAGVAMMFPTRRGGNAGPGAKEGFFGEVDDVIAAADFLAKQGFVDPSRIYLGGHSTGGTLALLVSECSGQFRAVFSFGPTDDVRGYGGSDLPFPLTDPKEIRLRAPGLWLHSIRSPTFVIEGTVGGNLSALRTMAKANKNPKCHFLEAAGADHFNLLGPLNGLIATKVLADTGRACAISLTPEEVNKPFKK